MADNGTASTGTISWTEIPAQDLASAQTFYGTVFGWEFSTTSVGDGSKPEVILFSKGPTHGSLVKVEKENHLSPAMHPDNPEKKRIAVRVTITVKNVDETLETVKKAGGAVYLPPREIGNNMGRIAYFTDSEKNVMGIWSAA
ncbi:hypothetical protein K469DRAFT_699966 [Zopfia rhizophila CBS 207.26]|uniref:VOC domain-containing protein n=1 Tax=Zopfia rhizophila CBS 207.26 TaxID=1314779 RepID=A0A6A6EIA0_9PEZI|nr:hypothetical protein K469DRAFT_699966 [Zopfia rhizophila CBS 207.26]